MKTAHTPRINYAEPILADHDLLMDAKGLPTYDQLKAINADLLAALEAIANLNPDDDSDEGWNEWGEADCYTKAVKIAKSAVDSFRAKE